MRERHHMLPVWFFIGVLLTIYGVIILITSIVDWSRASQAALAQNAPWGAQYHPGLWGGILLLLIGGLYVLKFRPRSGRSD